MGIGLTVLGALDPRSSLAPDSEDLDHRRVRRQPAIPEGRWSARRSLLAVKGHVVFQLTQMLRRECHDNRRDQGTLQTCIA